MKESVINKVKKLLALYKQGKLGGEVMPEDANPGLENSSNENLLYFTLPMALNYQRNSYKLWESALASFKDPETCSIFNPVLVVHMSIEELRQKLVKHKVALQPNKQPVIWQTLCKTIVNNFNGDLRNLFKNCNYNVAEIKKYITANKKNFPYLSGSKILNYWLYVIENYTNAQFSCRQEITIAPDTHVLQASVRLGIISTEELLKSDIRERTSLRWSQILNGTELLPIDLHTPFWLWSRNGFKVEL